MSLARLAAAIAPVVLSSMALAAPQYNIVDLGVVNQLDTSSTGNGISPNGTYVTGFSSRTGFNNALLWTQPTGSTPLPGVVTTPNRPFNIPNAVNNNGVAAGTAATTFFGSSPIPVLWKSGSATLLPIPAGETLGRVNGVNDAEQAVGSVDGGSLEQAAVFAESGSSVLTQTMPNGGVLRTAFGINNAGRIVGQASDPTNAAVTHGFYLDPGMTTAVDIGALAGLGHNSAIPFGVSSNGQITGSSSLNSGSGATAFRYDTVNGMTEVPLPAGSTTGQGRGINAAGWVVGNSSTATSIPFLFDGTQSYRLHDLLVNAPGWDLISGTSNAGLGISDDGRITGRGLLNGQVRGFVMIPVPEPTAGALLALAIPLVRRKRP